MNCDEAFEILTDPARNADAQLQWHLDMCARCRQMRDVLEPAMSLFGKTDETDADRPLNGMSIPADSAGHDDPANRPFLSVEAVRVAETAARRLHHTTRNASTPPPSRGRWLQYAAVMFIALSGIFAVQGVRERDLPTAAESACLWQARVSDQSVVPESPRLVVQSCIACHQLGHSLD